MKHESRGPGPGRGPGRGSGRRRPRCGYRVDVVCKGEERDGIVGWLGEIRCCSSIDLLVTSRCDGKERVSGSECEGQVSEGRSQSQVRADVFFLIPTSCLLQMERSG